MSASVTPNASTRFRLILPGCDVLRDSSLHYRATVSLPSLSSRDADRAKLERDVEAFLANGGTIDQVPVGVGRDSASPIRTSINESRPLRVAAVPKTRRTRGRKPVWTPEMDHTLTSKYANALKSALADELGVTVNRLYERALELGLYEPRTRGPKEVWKS